jgi:hypothetical protein
MRSNFLPRQSSYETGTIIRHAALDLSRPSLFMVGSWMILQALEQKTGQFGPVAGRQFRCLFVQVKDGSAHGPILSASGQHALSVSRRRPSP